MCSLSFLSRKHPLSSTLMRNCNPQNAGEKRREATLQSLESSLYGTIKFRHASAFSSLSYVLSRQKHFVLRDGFVFGFVLII